MGDWRTLLLIGIGVGDPRQLTLEAIDALNRTDVFFLFDKRRPHEGNSDHRDELLLFRESICRRHIVAGRSYRFVTLPSPSRPPISYGRQQDAAYSAAVAEWHRQRRCLLADAIASSLGPAETGAFLAWGDPSLYDSTLRLINRLSLTEALRVRVEVIPGITSVQMLCACHRIPLNQIGESVLVTTGRKLQQLMDQGEHALPATTVVMLDGRSVFQHLQRDDLMLYWGANLGTPYQAQLKGPLHEIKQKALAKRRAVKDSAGWVMDVYMMTTHKHIG